MADDLKFVIEQAREFALSEIENYRFINPRNVFAFIDDNSRTGMPVDQAVELAREKLEEKHQILSLDICKQEPYYVKFKELFEASKKNELMKHD